MIHHVSVGSNDVARAKAFYDPVMEAMGLKCLKSRDGAVDYGSTRLIFSIETPVDGEPATAGNGVHIAFDVEERGQVDAFHAAGLANGGTDAGAPGVRPKYDANYYGAFLFDPDGNKVEAVSFMSK